MSKKIQKVKGALTRQQHIILHTSPYNTNKWKKEVHYEKNAIGAAETCRIQRYVGTMTL